MFSTFSKKKVENVTNKFDWFVDFWILKSEMFETFGWDIERFFICTKILYTRCFYIELKSYEISTTEFFFTGRKRRVWKWNFTSIFRAVIFYKGVQNLEQLETTLNWTLFVDRQWLTTYNFTKDPIFQKKISFRCYD